MGASIGIPTAGDNEFTGSGQWQLGPTVAYLNTKTKGLQWGMMVYQNWDVASTRSDAGDVDNLNFQPILNYHFGTGWYVGLPDLPQTYNNETNNWTTQLAACLEESSPMANSTYRCTEACITTPRKMTRRLPASGP